MTASLRLLRRRPAPAAAVLYAALALVMVGQGLLPDRTLSRVGLPGSARPGRPSAPTASAASARTPSWPTPSRSSSRSRSYARERLPDVPLWNPHVMGGRPFLANAQSAVFSPFSLPSYVLPFWTSLGIAAALKLWVAAFGAFRSAARSGWAARARCWPGSRSASASAS